MKTCAGVAIGCRVLNLDRVAKAGQSIEEAARTARYEALLQSVTSGTVVLTAQHRDDQAETILLQLLRGSGLKGLSGMPGSIAFGPGILHRPLLRFARSCILSHADSRDLSWIDDPSNADTVHDRNYLRHEIIPRLKARWPGLDKTLARSGKHCAEAQNLIDARVEFWYQSLIEPKQNTISITKLTEFDEIEQRSILRHWIRKSGFRSPSEVKLEQIISEAIAAGPDRFPRIQWDGAEVRRYRNHLYLFSPAGEFNSNRVIPWSLPSPLFIPELQGVLECCWSQTADTGIAVQGVNIRFRKGGESCRLPGRGKRSLKKIFQELAVPPWERDRIPLIYSGDELAAIGDLMVCEAFQKLGLQFRWTRQGVRK